VDYTQAFPQADLEDPIFIQIPQDWCIQDGKLTQHENSKFNDIQHDMKLKRNLYGCKQSAHNWFKHLTKGLLHQGFTQSKTYRHLFLPKDCILVVYVDGCLLFAKDSKVIDNLIADLSKNFL
jgi:hypothetical protein